MGVRSSSFSLSGALAPARKLKLELQTLTRRARPRQDCSVLAAVSLALLAVGASFAAEIDESKLPPAASVKIDFVRDIKPILTNQCYKCHSGEKPKSHFLLTTRENALKGGSQGVDILPGNSAKSPLVHYVARLVEDMEMPPEGKGTPLTPEQVGLVRAWIDQGVAWEKTEPERRTEVIVTPMIGSTHVNGQAAKFQELYWQRKDWYGGLDEFEAKQKLGQDSAITVAGHVLPDDYKLTLDAQKNDLGFTRLGWTQFRKYYDGAGGYYPGFVPPIFDIKQDLYLDNSRFWADLGLTLPDWPRMVLGYEYQSRSGTESTLAWGPVNEGKETRNIFPGLKTISESAHILKFDVDYEPAGVVITDSFRAEWYHLSTVSRNASYVALGYGGAAVTTAAEGQTDFQGANTIHLEKQFTDWLFAAGGYLYSKYNGDAAVDVATANLEFLGLGAAPGWNAPNVTLERQSHVFSLSGLFGPWQGLALSWAVQSEWTSQQGLGLSSVNLSVPFKPFVLAVPPEQDTSDLDRSVFGQDVGLRFTKIPFTTVFADARWQQDQSGLSAQEIGGLSPFLLDTDTKTALQDYRAGFNTSPWRRVSLSGQYRYYDDDTHYDNRLKESHGQTYEGYPGFIRWRDVLSQELQMKLALQVTPWLKTTLGYQWMANDYHMATDPVTDFAAKLSGGLSPGGTLLAGTYKSQTLSLNATLTPWRRLFLSATAAAQYARTVTAANDSPSVAPYVGTIYSLMASGTYAFNEKTSLSASTSLSTADFAENNYAAGLPLGINYQQLAVQIGLRRSFGKRTTAGLQYRFYHYNEPSSGGYNNFNAQAVFATLSFSVQ
jgi:hypothetical protein